MPDVDAIGRLVQALREVPEDGTPYEVPGDGSFRWNFGEYLIDERRWSTLSPMQRSSRGLDGWTFCGSIGCALGLAKLMGMVNTTDPEDLAAALDIPVLDAAHVFLYPWTYEKVRFGDVTAAMVADELERRYLR